jgi:hypothetical protein
VVLTRELREVVLNKLFRGLYVQVTVHRDKFHIKKRIRRIKNIQNLFCHKTPHVSDTFCAHHQELSAVRTAIGTFHAVYVTAS